MSPAAALLWPCGEPEAERHGAGLPTGWSIAIGFDAEYWLGVHTGLDINLPGQADYGKPCYAVADGVVTSAGAQRGTWGNVILIRHPSVPGLGTVWSQYAHLSAVDVAAGAIVTQGQRIGALGNGATNGHGPTVSAHLHFELRRTDLAPGRWPSGTGKSQSAAVHQFIRANYLDPLGLLGT